MWYKVHVYVYERVSAVEIDRERVLVLTMSLRRYLKPTTKLPTPEQAKLPATVLKEVNRAVASTLERGKEGESKYTATWFERSQTWT